MAIKINTNTVIDNSQNLTNINNATIGGTLTAGGNVGTAGSVLTSSGTGIYWSSGSTVVGAATTYSFSSSGTFTKPSVGTYALVRLWGGGGSGSRDSNGHGGGGGGACVERMFYLSQIPPSVTVTIGSGGPPVTSAGGNVGGASWFAPGFPTPAVYFIAYGGSGGYPGAGGGGGGSLSSGATPNPVGFNLGSGVQLTENYGRGVVNCVIVTYGPSAAPTGYSVLTGAYDGGAFRTTGYADGNFNPNRLATIYGGAAGGVDGAGTTAGIGADTIWGGGGGASGGSPSKAGGTTVYGGPGGAAGAQGSAKGGGGGGVSPGVAASSGAGGDGYCEILVW